MSYFWQTEVRLFQQHFNFNLEKCRMTMNNFNEILKLIMARFVNICWNSGTGEIKEIFYICFTKI